MTSDRTECPRCGRSVLLRKDGLVSLHRNRPHKGVTCEGSLEPPFNRLSAELAVVRSERDWLAGKVEVYEAAIAATLADGGVMRLALAQGTVGRVTTGGDD